MNCPFCKSEMLKGKLCTRGENYFVPDGCKTPTFYTHKGMEKAGAILVSPDSLSASYEADWQTAWICNNCRKMVVDY